MVSFPNKFLRILCSEAGQLKTSETFFGAMMLSWDVTYIHEMMKVLHRALSVEILLVFPEILREE